MFHRDVVKVSSAVIFSGFVSYVGLSCRVFFARDG